MTQQQLVISVADRLHRIRMFCPNVVPCVAGHTLSVVEDRCVAVMTSKKLRL